MSQTTEQIQKSDIKDILENSLKGNRPGPEDILRLLESNDVHLMGLVSGYLTKKQFGNKASFVNNIILIILMSVSLIANFVHFIDPPELKILTLCLLTKLNAC